MTQKLVLLQRRLAGLDLELPPKMAALLATWEAVNTVNVEDPLAELRATIATGDLDAKTATKLVRGAVSGFADQKYGREIAYDLAGAFHQAEKVVFGGTALDDIIEMLGPAFDTAVGELAEVVPFLGSAPDKATLAGPQSYVMFGRWEAAVQQLGKVTAIRRALGGEGYAGDLHPDTVQYLADAATPADLDVAHRLFHQQGDGFSHLVAHGIALRLNTATEARAILAKVAAKVAAETAERDARQSEIARAQGQAEAEAWRTGTIIPPEARVRPVPGTEQPAA